MFTGDQGESLSGPVSGTTGDIGEDFVVIEVSPVDSSWTTSAERVHRKWVDFCRRYRWIAFRRKLWAGLGHLLRDIAIAGKPYK